MCDNTWEGLTEQYPFMKQYCFFSSEARHSIVFTHAYKDMTPRTIPGLRKNEHMVDALSFLLESINQYLNGDPAACQGAYDQWHQSVCEGFLQRVVKGFDLHYGKAQKILNMAMKDIYCTTGGSEHEEYFTYCHMPIDSYILNWFCRVVYRERPRWNCSWSNLECGSPDTIHTYLWIQDRIRDYLKNNEKNQYRSSNAESLSPFQAEFYIWEGEKDRKAKKLK